VNRRAAWLVAALIAMPAGLAAQASPQPTETQATAIFAGGCFWCMEPPFDALPGVISTTAGYTGGRVVNPTYEEVSAGGTGHAEAVEVRYDAARVTYAELLDVFWRNVDPFATDRQFCDRGEQYRAAIFYRDDEQKRLAQASKRGLEEELGKPFTTAIEPARRFYAAETYHQDYYVKNPIRYKFYRYNCGRDKRLAEVWGDAAEKHE
jgi:peptide-methionine (S)-S-oxide reductase